MKTKEKTKEEKTSNLMFDVMLKAVEEKEVLKQELELTKQALEELKNDYQEICDELATETTKRAELAENMFHKKLTIERRIKELENETTNVQTKMRNIESKLISLSIGKRLFNWTNKVIVIFDKEFLRNPQK